MADVNFFATRDQYLFICYNDIIKFTFTGNGFLRYQIRNMVGILIKVGEEKELPEYVEKFLNKKDRSKGGKTAPAEGLYLTSIKYNM